MEKIIMKKVVLILGLFTLCNLSFGQQKIDFNLENSCCYYGEKVEEDIYSFASTQEAEKIVKRILDVVGLEPNFTIMAANVPNAMAVIENQMRHILYSQDFIMRIDNATGTDWASLSILAHEIAHHLQGHTITSSGSRPNLELEADKWSGFVCAKLGATLDQAQAAMKSIASNTGSSTHPPKSARLE
ncbi:MAG: hypothetical protein LBV26_07810, partial [Bacteroidales bacterium]|nr:hypothetical protein [Bacteroidales bacterium]